MSVSAQAGSNADVVLAFDSGETLPDGTPASIGLRLAQDRDGSYAYRAYDEAAAATIQEAANAGFAVNPTTLEIVFSKDNWSGPFGAYVDRPGQSRPSHGNGVDFRPRNPCLAPRVYSAGLSSDQNNLPANIQAPGYEFNSGMYVSNGEYIHKLGTWGTPGAAYFTQVHYSYQANFLNFAIHNGYLYVADSVNPYSYSADGATWTESTRGASLGFARAFLSLNGMLHKYRLDANYDTQHVSSTDGINAGSPWTDEEAIGMRMSYFTAPLMLAIGDSLVFAKNEGIYNIDGFGKKTPLYPELTTLAEIGNGAGSFVWNNGLIYPTVRGPVMMLKDGAVLKITPALQQGAGILSAPSSISMPVFSPGPVPLGRVYPTLPSGGEVKGPAVNGNYMGKIVAQAGTQDYLFAALQKPADSTHRIMVLEATPSGYVWRTLFDRSATSIAAMWVTSQSTSGTVLWWAEGKKAYYCYIANSPEPTQDSRSRFAATGNLYDPWIDCGIPTVPKRWAQLDMGYMASATGTDTTLTITLYMEDGTSFSKAVTPSSTPSFTSWDLPAAWVSKRIRVEVAFATSDATKTPILLSYRIRAFARPTPVNAFDLTAMIPASGIVGGLANMSEARAFFKYVDAAQRPLTLTDPYGDTYRVMVPVTGISLSAPRKNEGRWDTAAGIRMIEVPVGS